MALPRRRANRQPTSLTVACPACDVTWRGTLADACWACGETGHVIAAQPEQVKVPATR